jgi:hypothetical protein
LEPSKGNRASGLMADKWRRAWSINRSSSFIYVCATILISLSQVLSVYSLPPFLSLRRSLMKDRHYWPYIQENDNGESVARWLANFFTIKRAHWISCGRRGDEKPNAFYTFLIISRPCPIWFFLLAVLSHHLNICRYFYM